jgi:polyhydroxybutyrate depolymerase
VGALSGRRWGIAVLALLSCSRPLQVELVVRPDVALMRQRPVRLQVPQGLDPSRPAPLLIALHGFGARGASIDKYFGLGRLAARRGILYVAPDGTPDGRGLRFWGATDACCDLDGRGPDDVAYLSAIIRDVSARYLVDRRRVFVVGHSNGGFMAHRLACEASELVAGVVSLAGATWQDPARCRPGSPVAVLQIHGTEDDVIRYGGGRWAPGMAAHPGAAGSVARWARLDGCAGPLAATGDRLDLDTGVPGAETRVERHGGCRGGAAELWTIEGGGHGPRLPPSSFAASVLAFLLAHPKAG